VKVLLPKTASRNQIFIKVNIFEAPLFVISYLSTPSQKSVPFGWKTASILNFTPYIKIAF